MQIKNLEKSYSEVANMKIPTYRKPKKPNILFRTLLKIVSLPDLIATRFRCRRVGMEKLGRREPALFLMNHSSFIDLEIASSILYPRPFNIVATLDAFVGKSWLMRQLGCISTRKFVFDLTLVKDISYCIKDLKSSVLMYPEAGYTFDGTATTLPSSLAKFVKMLGAPLVMIETFGAFHRKPLYNNLQARKVKVSAEMRYLLSAKQIKEMPVEEIEKILTEEFSFDNFRWQQENKIKIDEPTRADGLERLLYKCPHCLAEGKMLGKGTELVCTACQKKWTLTEYGSMQAQDGNTEFPHIPDWYKWERACVKEEIEDKSYSFSIPVDIFMIVNEKGVFKVGSGQLSHDLDGIRLVGCDGQLDYSQKSISMYTLNSDYYWYKLGDVIGIGNHKALYYSIPQNTDDAYLVTKARLATEEIFEKIKR